MERINSEYTISKRVLYKRGLSTPLIIKPIKPITPFTIKLSTFQFNHHLTKPQVFHISYLTITYLAIHLKTTTPLNYHCVHLQELTISHLICSTIYALQLTIQVNHPKVYSIQFLIPYLIIICININLTIIYH